MCGKIFNSVQVNKKVIYVRIVRINKKVNMYELTFLVSENISKQQLGIYLDYCPVKVRNNCFKRNSELKGFQN